MLTLYKWTCANDDKISFFQYNLKQCIYVWECSHLNVGSLFQRNVPVPHIFRSCSQCRHRLNQTLNMRKNHTKFCLIYSHKWLWSFGEQLCPTPCYLNPRPPVILSSCPGVYKSLLIQPSVVGIPLLESKESSVGGRSRDLLIGYDPAFDSQWPGAFWKEVMKNMYVYQNGKNDRLYGNGI